MIEVSYTTRTGATDAGETFVLNSMDAGLNSNDLRGGKWSVKNSRLRREAQTYGGTVFFTNIGEANRFTRLCDMDAEAGRLGTLKVGEWALQCNVVEVECIPTTMGAAGYNLTFRAPKPVWRRSRLVQLRPESASGTQRSGLDYPTDYEFDLMGVSRASSIGEVEGSALAKVTFYGSCQSPYLRLTSTNAGGTTTNVYGVDANAGSGERIVIDPTRRTEAGQAICKIGRYGEKTNLYASRRRGAEGSGSYVFEKMPAGTVSASWPQNIGVDVELIEERGVLPWS